MSTTLSYIRRSRQQWAELIELQSRPGLSAPKFCKQAVVSYQNFMVWRKKIKSPQAEVNDTPNFVELTTHHSPSSNGIK